MSPVHARAHAAQVLHAPMSGQVLRQSMAQHRADELATWTAWASSLRVAGYRVDPRRLAEQLLQHGCARVEDAFGQPVAVEVPVPPRPARSGHPEDPGATGFRISS